MAFAIIDIGSNSVRYMEADVPFEKGVYTTRLGSGLAETGRLGDAPMEMSIACIRGLAQAARAKGLVPMAYATSAVRDAANGAEFALRVERECNVPVDIISGEREAKYAFIGALGSDADGGLIDIGGASCQVATSSFKRSYPMGCVRGGDIARQATGAVDCDDDPAAQRLAVERHMAGLIAAPRIRVNGFTGVGGTITTLGAMDLGLDSFDAAAVHGMRMTRWDVEKLISELIAMGSRRREHPMLRQRHDVILYGAYILAKLMDLLNISDMKVSCSDGMEGYLTYLKGRENGIDQQG